MVARRALRIETRSIAVVVSNPQHDVMIATKLADIPNLTVFGGFYNSETTQTTMAPGARRSPQFLQVPCLATPRSVQVLPRWVADRCRSWRKDTPESHFESVKGQDLFHPESGLVTSSLKTVSHEEKLCNWLAGSASGVARCRLTKTG